MEIKLVRVSVFITTLGRVDAGSEGRKCLIQCSGSAWVCADILPGFRPLPLNGCVTLGKLPNFSKAYIYLSIYLCTYLSIIYQSVTYLQSISIPIDISKSYGDDYVRLRLVCNKYSINGSLLEIIITLCCKYPIRIKNTFLFGLTFVFSKQLLE